MFEDTLYNYYINPYQAEQICTLSQWFSNLLPNWHPRLGLAEDSRTTTFQLGLLVLVLNQEDKFQTTMNIEHI